MRYIAIAGSVTAVLFCALVSGASSQAQDQQTAVNPALVAQGAWSATTTYHKDDLVTARGSTWRALTTSKNRVPGSTAPNTSKFWQLFARGFNPAGAWVSTTTYEPDDLVTAGGQTYRAKLTSRNKATTNVTYWEVFAAKGASGPNTGISDGTTGAPSISFTGDTGTGIYSPGAGLIAMVESGTLFMHNLGFNNTALGVGALTSSNGGSNVAIGHQALMNLTNGARNVAIGDGALIANLNGTGNVAIGPDSLKATQFATHNIAIGDGALATGDANDNVAIGVEAQGSNVSGHDNVSLGTASLVFNSTGNSNVAIGTNAMHDSISGANNVAVGNSALQHSNGGNNIAIGASAGVTPTAPANSIFIGNQGSSGDTTTIKIGTQSTQTSAFMAGITGVTVANSAAVLINTTTGQLGTVSSSRRYKEDIATMPDMSAALMKLRPVTFRYKKPLGDGSKPTQYGLIAEEVADALPYLAVFKDGRPETVKYHELPTFLLAAFQQQQKTIQSDKERIASLEQRLSQLDARLAHLSAHSSSASRHAHRHAHVASAQPHG